MNQIKAVFFDLDHTLWDFKTNSRETIADLYLRYELSNMGIGNLDAFLSVYENINHEMWQAYGQGKIGKEHLRKGRFANTLMHFQITDDLLADSMATDYVQESPRKMNLFPFVHETLSYLSGKYSLALITNGFTEVQHVKIAHCGLRDYFNHVLISEQIGFKKPHPAIFTHAASLSSAMPDQCLMVGDNLDADIKGALDAGMKACLYDPESPPRLDGDYPIINCLSRLMSML